MNETILSDMKLEKLKVERKCLTLNIIINCLYNSFGQGFMSTIDDENFDNVYRLRFNDYDVTVKYVNDRFHIHIDSVSTKSTLVAELLFYLTGEKDQYNIGHNELIQKCFDDIIEQISVIINDSKIMTNNNDDSKSRLGWSQKG